MLPVTPDINTFIIYICINVFKFVYLYFDGMMNYSKVAINITNATSNFEQYRSCRRAISLISRKLIGTTFRGSVLQWINYNSRIQGALIALTDTVYDMESNCGT